MSKQRYEELGALYINTFNKFFYPPFGVAREQLHEDSFLDKFEANIAAGIEDYDYFPTGEDDDLT